MIKIYKLFKKLRIYLIKQKPYILLLYKFLREYRLRAFASLEMIIAILIGACLSSMSLVAYQNIIPKVVAPNIIYYCEQDLIEDNIENNFFSIKKITNNFQITIKSMFIHKKCLIAIMKKELKDKYLLEDKENNIILISKNN